MGGGGIERQRCSSCRGARAVVKFIESMHSYASPMPPYTWRHHPCAAKRLNPAPATPCFSRSHPLCCAWPTCISLPPAGFDSRSHAYRTRRAWRARSTSSGTMPIRRGTPAAPKPAPMPALVPTSHFVPLCSSQTSTRGRAVLEQRGGDGQQRRESPTGGMGRPRRAGFEGARRHAAVRVLWVDATLGLVASRDGEEPCPEGLRAARLASWVLGLAVDCRLE